MKIVFNLLPVLFFLVINVHAANAASQGSGLLLTMPPILAAQANSTPAPLPPGTVKSAGGRIWMDRNLGASRVARSPTDAAAYGDLYQWGRLKDGHENRASHTTSVLSSSDVPNHSNFITSIVAPSDWRNPQNDNLWQGVTGTNNPCPKEFRVPTEEEWWIEHQSWDIPHPAEGGISKGAFDSPLKLVVAGFRQGSDGVITNTGEKGIYWSHSIEAFGSLYHEQAMSFGFEQYVAYIGFGVRADGLSIRCIKD